MPAYSYSRVLLLSNLGEDCGDISFRAGTYSNYLLPMASKLAVIAGIEVRLLANSAVARKIAPKLKAARLDGDHLASIHVDWLSETHLSDFMRRSYSGDVTESEVQTMMEKINSTLKGWVPDVILCWEAPTNALRKMFPDALVIDVMPSLFMRPPFPQMLSFDPVGLYRNCWYADLDLQSMTAPDDSLEQVSLLRAHYLQHFQDMDVEQYCSWVVPEYDRRNNILVPLQISDYFGWKDNCQYENQFDYLNSVQKASRKSDNLIITQYSGSLISEKVITDKNIYSFANGAKNIVYHSSFGIIDNISQYLLPYCDEVYSVSSTLGIQAKFFGKRLVSPSRSHLSYLADRVDLSAGTDTGNRNIDAFMAHYIGRSCILWKRIKEDDQYLATLIDDYNARRRETGAERLPSFELTGNSFQALADASAIPASTKKLERLQKHGSAMSGLQKSELVDVISSNQFVAVSFDVFDTLVCRNVLHPQDVFKLMSQRLAEQTAYVFDPDFLENFPSLRAGVERKLRYKLDKQSDKQRDELKVRDIYIELLAMLDMPAHLVDLLINAEQDVELACLQPRQSGKVLFEAAKTTGAKIVIISDFLHPTEFVERVLLENGFLGWDRLFVSSEWGQKKHSGKLFDIVCEALACQPSDFLHIGDNPTGDIKMANAKGFATMHLKSGPALSKEIVQKRSFNLNAIRSSIVTGAILSAHANCNLEKQYWNTGKSSGSNLISTPYELGFLLLGPLMHFFSTWLINEARQNDIQQILFFARDSSIPFQIIKNRLATSATDDLSICYLPVSRLSLTGVDIYKPSDLYKIRIDDYNKNGTLLDLLERRFMLTADQVSAKAARQWTDKEIASIKVEALPELAIYEIAVQSALDNWPTYFQKVEQKREIFCEAMRQWGVDRNARTMAVDFGYKGTIHKKLKPLFSGTVLPRFFVSYANAVGRDPIEEVRAFYKNNLTPQAKSSDPILDFNLMLETLLNEGAGSAEGYSIGQHGIVDVDKQPISNPFHSETIEALHKGAVDFSGYWEAHCTIIDRYADLEPNMLLFFVEAIFTSPNVREASIISSLHFDNAYAGHDIKPLVKQKGGPIPQRSLWPQGARVLASSNDGDDADGRYRSWRLIIAPIVRLFVARMGTYEDVIEFDRNPREFFRNLRDPHYQKLGRILFP